MYGILLTIHIVIAVMLIGLVLIQQGKGAQTGAAFGSGASTTVFGSQGSGNFLSRATGFLGAAFFIISLSLAFLLSKESRRENQLNILPAGIEAQSTNSNSQIEIVD
jgi:preprotein translocase subunit SecG